MNTSPAIPSFFDGFNRALSPAPRNKDEPFNEWFMPDLMDIIPADDFAVSPLIIGTDLVDEKDYFFGHFDRKRMIKLIE